MTAKFHRFAIVPLEAIADRRLSLVELRVLLALFSFCRRGTNRGGTSIVWPKRKTLSELCGLRERKISETTTALQRLGWLTKEGVGGRWRPARYTITVPQLETVSEQNNPRIGDGSEMETVPESGTKTVPESGTGIEQRSEQRSEQSKSTARNLVPPPDEIPKKNPDSEKKTSESAAVPEEILKKKRKAGVTFDTFIAECRAKGEKAISDYKPIMEYSQKIGLPMDFTVLCWDEFKRRHSKGGLAEGKRYADWRRAFRNCLEGNWYRLWYFDQGSGKFVLSSNGAAAERATA